MKRFVTAVLLCVSLISSSVHAQRAVPSELKLRRLGAYFVSNSNQTGTSVSGTAAGTGACYELALPQINDQAGLAKAIEDYIREKKPESPFVNLGSDIVAGSVKQGINPMFIVGNLRMESAFATTGADDVNPDSRNLATLLHRHYNGFGRTAGSSQPNFASSTGRLWYAYPSWKDSVNSPSASPTNTTDQPSLMRKVYLDDGLLTIGQYLGRYAPASDGNDESVYGRVMKDVIGAIISKAGTSLSCTDNTSVVSDVGGA